MNDTSQVIFQAVDVLLEKAISQLQYDRTIKAEIDSIVNLDTGEYKVKYSGNIISAFATDVEKQYEVGDNVYVTIPENNLSNKKMITGLVSSKSLSYGQMVSLSNSIVPISPTFDNMYDYDARQEYGVVAGAPPESELSYNVIFDGSDTDFHGLFQQYARNYNLIRIKASFLTRFHCEHSKGNYGIEVQFYTKSGDSVSYKLDLNSFIGDPYSLSVYSPQYVIIQAQDNFLTGLKQIKLFEENFVYDRYVEAGVPTDKENRTVPNIFVKDIEIQFVERRDLTGDTYYLDISMPQGNSFTSSITSLDLVGRLVYQGENLMDESTCECKWFQRDLSVLVGSELYDKNAGAGWAPVEAADFNTMKLIPSDVPHQKQFKLVVTYNGNVTLSAEAEVYNLNSQYDFELIQTTVGEDIVLQIKNNADNTSLLGDWYMLYPDGSYSQVGTKQNFLIATNLLLYSTVTFYCGVYNTAGAEIIGVLSHVIASSESEQDITISYIGEDSFRYDANGDITVEDAEKERTLQVTLTWRDGVGTSYRVEWIGPDGQDITNTRYNPAQSMIENLWVDNNNILHYTIKQKYKVNYSNNTITVRIITIDDKTYNFQKEILFLKDGDQGTNGTTYITAVRPFDTETGQKIAGLVPLIYRNGTWQNDLPLRCYVYKDGELINDNPNYTLTYEWTGVNITLATGEDSDRRIARGQDLIITGPAGPYVTVKVTINDNMNDRTYDIYCLYPIDVVVGFGDNEISTIDISSIPSYIKYTASGVNPSFYNNNIEFLVNEEDYSQNISSMTEEILAIEEQEGLYYLTPASSFIFENNSTALLKCQYSDTKYLYHPVILYLDNYGNEAINGWDGTALAIDEENKQYIFAPQIGAGIKDSFNRFTGVVMGKDSVNKKIGLYGYKSGLNTFGLMEDGIAYFGAKSGGGQIVIDGTTAQIYGGGNSPAGSGKGDVGGDAANGMTITLADLNADGNTEAIKIGGGVFTVDYNGALSATSANISGVIYALSGRIGCTSRTSSDGWIIETNRLYSGNGSTRVELNSQAATNTSSPANNNDFAIWAGSTTATNAKFSVSKGGLITAREGNIGGWILSSNKLTSDNYRTGMASSGSYRFWAGADRNSTADNPIFSGSSYFYVTSSGEMTCRNAIINGEINAESGRIGNWYIRNNRLENSDGSVYLSSSGLRVGDDFQVSSSGRLTAKNAEINGQISANSGNIGDWEINGGRLESSDGEVYLGPRGLQVGDDFSVDNSGKLTVNNAEINGDIYADSGEIGGWKITADGIEDRDGATLLGSNGIISTEYVNIRYYGDSLGSLGWVRGDASGQSTDNIGIESNGSSSIILESSNNIRLTADGSRGDIYLEGDKLDVTGMSRIEGITADVIEGLEDFILQVTGG